VKERALQAMKLALGFIALAFCAAPVPGDVGGCGQDPQPLDPETFLWSLKDQECAGCRRCGIVSRACERACSDTLGQTEFPKNCEPLVHDGEVCLRVMQDSDCADFDAYMSDSSPTVPTECNFCPAGATP
jgi:hypothetical protein